MAMPLGAAVILGQGTASPQAAGASVPRGTQGPAGLCTHGSAHCLVTAMTQKLVKMHHFQCGKQQAGHGACWQSPSLSTPPAKARYMAPQPADRHGARTGPDKSVPSQEWRRLCSENQTEALGKKVLFTPLDGIPGTGAPPQGHLQAWLELAWARTVLDAALVYSTPFMNSRNSVERGPDGSVRRGVQRGTGSRAPASCPSPS